VKESGRATPRLLAAALCPASSRRTRLTAEPPTISAPPRGYGMMTLPEDTVACCSTAARTAVPMVRTATVSGMRLVPSWHLAKPHSHRDMNGAGRDDEG